MKTHVKVCMKSDWSLYCVEGEFDRLKGAMIAGRVIEVENAFGGREIIQGEDISVVLMSTVESRAAYEVFEKMISDEIEEEKEPWEK